MSKETLLEMIENPERALAETRKAQIVESLSDVLRATTGKTESAERVRKYAFGLVDRGRVLSLFKDGERIVGFISFHLLNNENGLIRLSNGSTVVHAGSGHILPEYQGNHLWLEPARRFIASLPPETRPDYLEAFTQSPRFFRMMVLFTRGEIQPNPFLQQNDFLREAQAFLLPEILNGFGDSVCVRDGCVVEGIQDDPVYASRIYTGQPVFDDFFFAQLQLKPEQGEFVHFVGKLPPEVYDYCRA